MALPLLEKNMASPTRFLSGITPAASFQPLGHCGVPDPFFYAEYADDFLHYNAGDYTVTASGGSVAATAANGSGGRILFTTGATGGNFAEIQLSAAQFQIVSGKKLFYLCRIRPTIITTNAFIAGLIETNTTPFSAIADGIYFSKAAGSSDIVLNVVTGSTSIGTATISGALTAATDIDLGFYVDRSGNIKAFYGNSLEGYKRPNTATLGPNVGILSSALTGSLTAALLNPTLAFSNGATAAATTGIADFQFAAQER
jgi:hypothetical protein